MGKARKSNSEAWRISQETLATGVAVFLDEPFGIESTLDQHCALGGSSRKLWTDGYLAAFAEAGDLELASFDRDFERYPGLRLTLLSSATRRS